ncbi:MAG: hypothetical protein CMN72_15445 [Sphingomonas sp.]|nr:hypothetical protein [Sphingomonas sp.]
MVRALSLLFAACAIGTLGWFLSLSDLLSAQLERLGLSAPLASLAIWLLWVTGWWRGLRLLAALRDQWRVSSHR